jgi:hypothetical protein
MPRAIAPRPCSFACIIQSFRRLGAAQFELWRHTQLIIDVVPGRGVGFSVEAPEGVRFLTRGRVFSDAELAALRGAPFAA